MDSVISLVLSCRDYSQLPDRCILSTPFHRKKHVSYGIMIWAKSSDKWLIVRSKYSYAYFLFLGGMYRKTDIKNIISNMTQEEISIIKELYYGTKQFKDVYHGSNYYTALERFYQIRSCLRLYLNLSGTPTTAWTFPKGRLEHRESPWQCSIREFNEETGLDIYDIKGRCICEEPFVENYLSFDHEIYETKCWLYEIDDIVELSQPNGDEIVERKWVSTEEARTILSPTKWLMIQQAKEFISEMNNY